MNVQVVQRRHPENPFVNARKTPAPADSRFVPDYEGGREFAFVAGAPDGFSSGRGHKCAAGLPALLTRENSNEVAAAVSTE